MSDGTTSAYDCSALFMTVEHASFTNRDVRTTFFRCGKALWRTGVEKSGRSARREHSEHEPRGRPVQNGNANRRNERGSLRRLHGGGGSRTRVREQLSRSFYVRIPPFRVSPSHLLQAGEQPSTGQPCSFSSAASRHHTQTSLTWMTPGNPPQASWLPNGCSNQRKLITQPERSYRSQVQIFPRV